MDHDYYNSKTKIWSGPKAPYAFNPALGLGEIIHEALLKRPKKVAQILADDASQKTFEEIHVDSVKVAKNLVKLGQKLGDIVSVAGRNNKDIASVVFGCFFVGATVNTLDPIFEKDDLAHMFGIVKPKLVVCERSNLDHVKAALKEQNLSVQVLVFGETVSSVLLQEVDEEFDVKIFEPIKITDSAKQTGMIVCSSGKTIAKEFKI